MSMKYEAGDEIYVLRGKGRMVAMCVVKNARCSYNGRHMGYYTDSHYVKARDVLGPVMDLTEPE